MITAYRITCNRKTHLDGLGLSLRQYKLTTKINSKQLRLKEHNHDLAHAQDFDFWTGGQEFKDAGVVI